MSANGKLRHAVVWRICEVNLIYYSTFSTQLSMTSAKQLYCSSVHYGSLAEETDRRLAVQKMETCRSENGHLENGGSLVSVDYHCKN
jgi:hypothetical protein